MSQELKLSPLNLSERLEVGTAIIKEAGAMAREAFIAMTPEKIAFKGPQDFLTETDITVEALLRERLNQAFPDDAVYGEEAGGEIKANTWILDPIDGTANFARGIPHFCIVIAFVSEGETQLGLIFDPIHNELFVAQKGQGATMNGSAIAVAKTDSFEAANLELGWNQRASQDKYFSTLQGLIELGGNVRRSACGALALAYVAIGRTDGYVELHMNPWDCLAGLLLVNEAGGVVNNFTAMDDWHNGGPVLAATPALSIAIARNASISID
ncbi:inositol monophosphatase [Photobacterium makurazakiensis]|uniref:inositol monophosphatase family protein n=1 Tax=Photobacterium makurazakiensis TaxID=2910234 RepID=UPI003D1052A5